MHVQNIIFVDNDNQRYGLVTVKTPLCLNNQILLESYVLIAPYLPLKKI